MRTGTSYPSMECINVICPGSAYCLIFDLFKYQVSALSIALLLVLPVMLLRVRTLLTLLIISKTSQARPHQKQPKVVKRLDKEFYLYLPKEKIEHFNYIIQT